MVEDMRDNVRRDLLDSNRRIRELDETIELQRKEINEMKRYLSDEAREKDIIITSNDELRLKLKTAENDKTDLKRVLEETRQRVIVLEEQKNVITRETADLRNSLREVEKSRLEARRELQELRRQVKMLDSESKKKSKEVEDLQDRVKIDETREDEMRKEVFGQKQKVVETEATRDILKKELANLQRKYGELEDEVRQREKDYRVTLEESKRVERKAQDERRNLELTLESVNNALSETRIQLSGAEGRNGALEAQLARVEGARKDAEFKLSSIVSSLRRTIGLRPSSGSPGCALIKMMQSRNPSRSPSRRNRSPPLKGFADSPQKNLTTNSPSHGRSISPLNRSISPMRGSSDRNVIRPTIFFYSV
jgi:rootletin